MNMDSVTRLSLHGCILRYEWEGKSLNLHEDKVSLLLLVFL